jgi:hypothetical protein
MGPSEARNIEKIECDYVSRDDGGNARLRHDFVDLTETY